MNRHFAYRLVATLGVLGAALAGQGVTPAEKQHALTYLEQTRDQLLAATKGLSEAQLKFKPAPDRWSVIECVEHLTLIEGMVSQNVFTKLPAAAAPSAAWDAQKVDALLLAKVPDRSEKFQAPEPAVPTGRWTPAETIDQFVAGRKQTVAFLESSPDLRGHVVNHPVFGPMDGYEWVIAVAAHTERHTKQILEVKADRNFPQ